MISIKVNNKIVADKLRDLRVRIDNMKPAYEDIARILRNWTEDAFQKETSPFGKKWKTLSKRRIAERQAIGKWPGKILQVTAGGLAASIGTSASSRSATLFAGKDYAAQHQFGDKENRIPPRPFLPINERGEIPDAMAEEIIEAIEEWMALTK